MKQEVAEHLAADVGESLAGRAKGFRGACPVTPHHQPCSPPQWERGGSSHCKCS